MDKPAAPLHIFFAGNHIASDGTKHNFSEADVADLVASYDPELSEAQLVVGHPKIEDPSYGGVAALALDGKDVYAVPCNVHGEFAELVNARRYPNISASIYRPDDAGNPKPGHFYLRHVGFLGAQPPSLKGLKRPTLNYAENDGALEFSMPLGRRVSSLGYYLKRMFQGARDRAIETDGAEKAEQFFPQWCIDGIAEATAHDDDQALGSAFAEAALTTETPMSQQNNGNAADFAEQQKQLETRATEIEQREQALKDREDAARRGDAADFAEGLVQAGKILPRQKAGIVELLLAIPAGTVLNFAEGDGQAASDHNAPELLRNFLDELPTQVNFAEKSGGQHNGTATADFAAPEGTQVDAGRMELHSKAVSYQREHPGTDYMTAVKAVGGR